MNYSELELERIKKAAERPVELSPEQFAYEKKIKRYDPSDYTFQNFDFSNFLEHEQLLKPGTIIVRDLLKHSGRSDEQLDLFAVENTYD